MNVEGATWHAIVLDPEPFAATKALLAMVVMAVAMLAATAPAFAQGEGGCDVNPGASEEARSPIATPPETEPGVIGRSPTANEHDPRSEFTTGFGERVEECA